jgi:transposase
VIHADGTTTRVSSEGWWLHMMACSMVILLVCHEHRGRDAIDEIGVLPAFRGVMVHDVCPPMTTWRTRSTPNVAPICCAIWARL